MSERLHVKPARPGEVLRDPRTLRALPDEGGHVPDTTFWRRRLAEGDIVVIGDEPVVVQKTGVRAALPVVAQKGE